MSTLSLPVYAKWLPFLFPCEYAFTLLHLIVADAQVAALPAAVVICSAVLNGHSRSIYIQCALNCSSDESFSRMPSSTLILGLARAPGT
jgi:hypothetical protein